MILFSLYTIESFNRFISLFSLPIAPIFQRRLSANTQVGYQQATDDTYFYSLFCSVDSARLQSATVVWGLQCNTCCVEHLWHCAVC